MYKRQDIAIRLNLIIDKDKYHLYGISRTNKEFNINNHIKWDWLSTSSPELKKINFETIIFLPKPSSIDEDGYNEGFIQSTENIFSLTKDIVFNKFITISSTRVYGKNKRDLCLESDDIDPEEFRAKIINQYELNQIKRYENKLFILRFSGLYSSIMQKKSSNVLHRNNAAKIIYFFIQNSPDDNGNKIFNCSEDPIDNISNNKLKEAGFIFDSYN